MNKETGRGTAASVCVIALGLVVTLAGCLGTSGVDVVQEDRIQETHCRSKKMEGAVTPTEPLTRTAGINGTNVTAGLEGRSTSVGELQFTLERDGQEVWQESAGNPGAVGLDYAFDWQTSGLGPGNYTLTISTETGHHDVRATLAFAWGTGGCS